MQFLPILYKSTETAFDSFGLGRMTDCVSCTVSEELNSDQYELECTYPVKSALYSQIKVDEIIMAKAHRDDTAAQPFRIYSTETDLSSGLMTIKATHCALNLMHNCITVPGIISGTMSEILDAVKAGMIAGDDGWPFSWSTDVTVESDIDITVPTTLYDVFYDEENGILARFGAQIEFDRYTIKVLASRGENRGTSIRQGRDMSELTVVSDTSEVVSGIVPYYAVEDDDGVTTTVFSDPQILRAENAEVCFDHLLPIDCTSGIEKPSWAGDEWTPEPEDIYEWGRQYLAANYDGSIPTTYAAGVVTSADSITGDIQIGDTVTVLSKTLNTRITAIVTGTEYNCLNDQYDSVSVGKVKTNLAQTLVDMTNSKQSTTKIQTTARHGTAGDFSWVSNLDGNIVDMTFRHSISGVACKTYYGGKYRTAAITVSVPETVQNFYDWTLEYYEPKFNSATDVECTITYTLSQTSITVYVYAAKSCTVSGEIYIHRHLNSGELTDTYFVTPVSTTYTKALYWYADCLGKNYKFTTYANKTGSCYGTCGDMYGGVYNMGSYYKAGFCSQGGSSTAIGTGDNWEAPADTKIYVDSKMGTTIGTIPKGTKCQCLAILGNSFLLIWKVAGQSYHRIGFTRVSGGILEDEESEG